MEDFQFWQNWVCFLVMLNTCVHFIPPCGLLKRVQKRTLLRHRYETALTTLRNHETNWTFNWRLIWLWFVYVENRAFSSEKKVQLTWSRIKLEDLNFWQNWISTSVGWQKVKCASFILLLVFPSIQAEALLKTPRWTSSISLEKF